MEKTPSDSVSGGMRTLRDMLGLAAGEKIPAARVADIRVGSTISTNTLLERKGDAHRRFVDPRLCRFVGHWQSDAAAAV